MKIIAKKLVESGKFSSTTFFSQKNCQMEASQNNKRDITKTWTYFLITRQIVKYIIKNSQ